MNTTTVVLIVAVVALGAFALVEANKAKAESGLGGGINQILDAFGGGGATTSPLALLGL